MFLPNMHHSYNTELRHQHGSLLQWPLMNAYGKRDLQALSCVAILTYPYFYTSQSRYKGTGLSSGYYSYLSR
jgi:hypothetical protein